MKAIAVVSSLTILSTTLVSGCATNDPSQKSHTYSRQYSNSANSKNSDLGVIELMYQVRSGTNPSQADTSSRAMISENNAAKNKLSNSSVFHEIHVRMTNGSNATIVQERIDGLLIGSRVRIVDGQAYLY